MFVPSTAQVCRREPVFDMKFRCCYIEQKHPACAGYFCSEESRRLGARDVCGARTLLSIDYFKLYSVADFEFIKGDTVELLRVEEKILCFAIASNESESTVSERFDRSCHVFVFIFVLKLDYISPTKR